MEFTNLWKAYCNFLDIIKITLSKLMYTKSLTISVITYKFRSFFRKASISPNSIKKVPIFQLQRRLHNLFAQRKLA